MTVDIWQDVRDSLSKETRALFDLPPFSQATANPHSMANFASLISPLLETLAPNHFCEIGSEQGLNTQFLVDWCRKHEARLTIVDPIAQLSDDLKDEDCVTFRSQMSLEFLAERQEVDVYFVDGDHNYETVNQELPAIDQNRVEGNPITLFIHDTSWPWARRDLYYRPEFISAPNPHAGSGHCLSLYESILKVGTEGGNSRMWGEQIAINEGGQQNGVLTAVEDFLTGSAGAVWSRVSIPSLFGLTVLWVDSALSETQRSVFRNFAERMEAVRPFLNIHELNRLILLIRLQEAGLEWRRNQDTIARLTERLQRKERPLKAIADRLLRRHS